MRLKKDALSGGSDSLYVPKTTVNRMKKNLAMSKGMDIKLSKTNRKQVGGSLLSSILTLGRTLGPELAKTLGMSALAGVASEGASQLVKKISGGGGQTGGFLIPNSKIQQLIANKHLLSDKQKRDILNAIQTGSGVHIKPTKKQTGGFLSTLLASIGIPLALEAFKKMTGSGGPRMGKAPKQDGGAAPRLGAYKPPPPFFGTWEQPAGTVGAEKKKTKKKTGDGLLLGKNSPFNQIPLLGAIF